MMSFKSDQLPHFVKPELANCACVPFWKQNAVILFFCEMRTDFPQSQFQYMSSYQYVDNTLNM